MKPKFTTYQIADVSTKHITQNDVMLILKRRNWSRQLRMTHGDIYAVWTDKEIFQDQLKDFRARGFSTAFLTIFQHLHDQNIPYVRFDAIAEEVEGLPEFS
jgi:hypothetical protein